MTEAQQLLDALDYYLFGKKDPIRLTTYETIHPQGFLEWAHDHLEVLVPFPTDLDCARNVLSKLAQGEMNVS